MAGVRVLREKEPDNCRLLDGHYFKGCRVAELAKELGSSPNAASQRLARLRDRLGARLSRHRRDAGAP